MSAGDFEALGPSAFAIAYRRPGSATEAEHMGQEGFLRTERLLADDVVFRGDGGGKAAAARSLSRNRVRCASTARAG